MVKIRLARTGKRHEPHYRIVAADSRRFRDGKYLKKIGYYNPRTKPPTLTYDKELLKKRIDLGAQMTDTVHDIFVKEGAIKQKQSRVAQIKNIILASKSRKEALQSAEGTPAPKESPVESSASDTTHASAKEPVTKKDEQEKAPVEETPVKKAPEKQAEKPSKNEDAPTDTPKEPTADPESKEAKK